MAHIIFRQGWCHIDVVLVLLQYCVSYGTYHFQSRLIAHLCCAGSPTVLCFIWHISFSVKADRTFMLCWFSYSIVFHMAHIIFSQGWSHIYVVLVLLQYCVSYGTYHFQSRLIAHLCCAGSPTVLWFTWHTFSVKADDAHLYYIIILLLMLLS